MTIWSYETLAKFKEARIGNNIISFDDLTKERILNYDGQEYHCWIAKKDKRSYLILNDDLSSLPIRIKETKQINEGNDVFHFIKGHSKVGFASERHYDFKTLISKFFDVKHTNNPQFNLFKIVAIASYCKRINARVCSNPEFGKDSTFEVLNFLTNKIAVFDKPRTMAKLEYGVVNRILMVNELVPKTEEEKRLVEQFLLSIGSLKPIYQKTSRGSASHSTHDAYNVENLSLIICYNNIGDIAKTDADNYFDRVFGNNVNTRFIPFKFSGKLDVEQFITKPLYNATIDDELLKVARTIEWFKLNWESELKPYKVDLNNIKVAGRQKDALQSIISFINIYSDDEKEFKSLVDMLLNAHYAYLSMIAGNTLLTNDKAEITNGFKDVTITEEDVNMSASPKVIGMEVSHLPSIPLNLNKVKEHIINSCSSKLNIDDFIRDNYKEYDLAVTSLIDKMKNEGDIFEMPAGFIQVLK